MKFWKRTRRAFSMICCLALILAMVPAVGAASGDFTIKNGVLTKYNGAGGAVTIPEGVTEIGDLAFSECAGLTSITIPDSVTKMGQLVFQQCTGLTSITLPKGLTTITAMTFNGCSNLASVTIPASVTNIEFEAFYDCGNLRDVYYAGTQAQWKAIDLDDYGNEDLLSATIHYNTVPEQPDKPSTTPDMPSGVDQTLRGPGYAIPTSGTYRGGQFGLGSGLDHSVKLLTVSNCQPRQDFSTINVYDQSGAKIKTDSDSFVNVAYGCQVNEVKAGFYPNPSDSTNLFLCKATFPRQYTVDITVSNQTITLTEGDRLNGPVNGYNTLALKCEYFDDYYGYYFFYLERQDETPEFAQTRPTIPTQPEQPTTPSQPEQPSQGSNGMARSDRGVPLSRRSDGNYELFWCDGALLLDGATGAVIEDTRKLKITTYSPEFKELSVREIPIELDEIGNIYFGQDYNFVVFGQDNFEESNTKEVLRIVKYSKDWKRLGAAALTDANTTDVIGQHGNLSFAETNGMLYIHTGRSTYTLSDGLRHNTNMTFSVRMSDMTVTNKRVLITSNDTGYVSHSLANDILVDGDNRLVTLDTGDGYPNGAMLYRYGKRAGEEKFQGRIGEVNTFITWPGPRADIKTGAQTTALAETSQGYLSAYLDSGKGSSYDLTKDSCSLYLAFTPKGSFNKESTKIRMVDSHTNGDSESALYSYLVPTSPEGGYLLWYTRAKTNTGYYGDYTLYYTTYQADGTVGTTKKLDNVPLPYNGPINVDGKVIWAGDTEDKEGLRFCVLDQSGAKVAYATGELAKNNSTIPTTPTNPTTPTKPTDPTTPAQTKTANPTNDKLTVNGVLQNPTVYKIGGSNYFQIRDVAAVLNGTEKQFSVGYSGGKVTATSGQPYETTGKELKGAPSSSKTATHSNDTILINGQEASLTVYKIGGSNYFKLRDLGKALNFYVGWTAGKGVYIETDKPYSE